MRLDTYCRVVVTIIGLALIAATAFAMLEQREKPAPCHEANCSYR